MRRCACAVLLALAGSAHAGAALEARDGWIREAPPGATALAGYVTLSNHGDRGARCDKVSSPDFGAAELHRTIVENGQSRMLRDQVLDIPAGGEARIEPGGFHLMLFRPVRALRAGDHATLTFDCDGQTVSADLTLRRTD